jgi:predicted aminopeptidase
MALGATAVLAVAGALCLTGCANLGYYWQSVSGHLELMSAARPVGELVAEESTPQRVREKLVLSQRIRDYASREMLLPDNPSYRRYADLHRNAAVWNVVAAPPYSLELKTWCFPVTGCVGYRGYYDEAKARAEARELVDQGYEAGAYPVPAYSTLGMMNWAGGDPLLNTFIHYPDGELARLLFHELAHQVVYAKNDTMFNESFATAVERLGGERWLATEASPAAREEYAAFDARRRQFRQFARPPEGGLRAARPHAGGKGRGQAQGAGGVPSGVRADACHLERRPAPVARLRPVGGARQQRAVRHAGRVRRAGARLRGAVPARGRRLAAVL